MSYPADTFLYSTNSGSEQVWIKCDETEGGPGDFLRIFGDDRLGSDAPPLPRNDLNEQMADASHEIAHPPGQNDVAAHDELGLLCVHLNDVRT